MQSMAVLSVFMFSIPMSFKFKTHCLGLKAQTRSFLHPSKEGHSTIFQPPITYLDQHNCIIFPWYCSKAAPLAILVYSKEKVTLQVRGSMYAVEPESGISDGWIIDHVTPNMGSAGIPWQVCLVLGRAML